MRVLDAGVTWGPLRALWDAPVVLGGGLNAAAALACAEGPQGVIVNLRIDTTEARMLGVETHVCELQLLLMSPEVWG